MKNPKKKSKQPARAPSPAVLAALAPKKRAKNPSARPAAARAPKKAWKSTPKTPRAVKTAKVVKNPERVIAALRLAVELGDKQILHRDQEIEHQANALDAHITHLEARLGKKAARLLIENWEKHPNGAIFGAKRLGAQARKMDLLTIAANTSWKDQHLADEKKLDAMRTELTGLQRLRETELAHLEKARKDFAEMRDDRDGAIRDMTRLLAEHKKMELDRDGAIAMLNQMNTDTPADDVCARVVCILQDGILTAPYSLTPIPVRILVVDLDNAAILPAHEVVDNCVYELHPEPLSAHLYAEHTEESVARIMPTPQPPEMSKAAGERIDTHLEGVDTAAPAEDGEEV